MTRGNATFNSTGALTQLDDSAKNTKILDGGMPVDANADGIVAWGRWTGGESKVNGANGEGKGKLVELHYFAFVTAPTQPVIATFGSFASTAPTVQSGGTLVATGSVNGASGTLSTAFLTASFSTARYSLTVPVQGQTFTLDGVAAATSAYGFSGVSLISSTGRACVPACTGSFGDNISVIGQLGGTAGNRAGVAYGFDSAIGNVSGVIVFKR